MHATDVKFASISLNISRYLPFVVMNETPPSLNWVNGIITQLTKNMFPLSYRNVISEFSKTIQNIQLMF